MDRLDDSDFAAAEARGRALTATGARAVAARHDPSSGRVAVELVNGCTFLFPTRLVEGLAGAPDDALADVIVEGQGFNLHWPALDTDLHVPALVAGVFGTKAWMRSALAREAGRTSSPAKAAAARANGLKGGRPRKQA
jgi:hypothetical protein